MLICNPVHHLFLLLTLASYTSSLEVQKQDQVHAPDSEQPVHHPSADGWSLSIVGDLKNVQLKSSIANLVQALQTPPNTEPHKPAEIITKHGTLNVHSPEGRALYYGEERRDLPSPITISSQAIRINSNKTGGKRSRSMSTVDADGVRTIEGVRVPDNEEDKHHTWRNARVIKGFLVPNDRSANPHAKRQVVIHTDPNAYLAAAAAAQAQGAATIMDGQQINGNMPQMIPYYGGAAQPVQQVHQSGLVYAQQPGQSYVLQQDRSGNSNPYLQQSSQQPVSQVSHSQIQFSSRSGEPPASAQSVPSQNSQAFAQQIAQAQAAVQAIQQLQLQSSTVPKEQSSSDPQFLIQQSQTAGIYHQGPTGSGFSERVVQVQNAQNNQAQPGFVIQPKTYVTGPGGQAFTIPIPVPADQVQQQQQQGQHQQWPQQFHRHPNQFHGGKHSKHNFADRVMEGLYNSKKALERVDTSTAVVPALASTGLFLGLSALAAGWYLSRGNREVGIVRRTGKPSRVRRDLQSNYNPQEVDQATFFQSIIQQSLEKSQQQYEDQNQAEPVYNPNIHQHSNQQPQLEPVYNHRERESKNPYRPRPQSRDDNNNNDYSSQKNAHHAQDKSGALTIGSSKNFAKVFIPALILGLSVISITALIFGWYITGANREIAFLEPASYSRKKRSLMASTALSDGWLQRTITAIHSNPYDKLPAPTSKSILPHPFLDRETSKTTSDLEFKISNAGVTGVLAGGALIALVALGLANSFSQTAADTKNARSGSSSTTFNSQHIKQLRAPRSYNDLRDGGLSDADNPGFISNILSSIYEAEQNVVKKLSNAGMFDPHSPCSKRLICEMLIQENDDTIKMTEKKVTTFVNLLPESVSKTLLKTVGDISSSVNKKECSTFTCISNHGIPSVKISPRFR